MLRFLWTDSPDIPDANKWRLIQQYRNELLSRCDWTQMPDVVLTFTEKQLWQDYRQALRDIPQAFTSPDDVVFPSVPGGNL
ncbi:phage tail assembly chaperone [bacterium]|nr:phage tail assembly chaperone [bacterium]